MAHAGATSSSKVRIPTLLSHVTYNRERSSTPPLTAIAPQAPLDTSDDESSSDDESEETFNDGSNEAFDNESSPSACNLDTLCAAAAHVEQAYAPPASFSFDTLVEAASHVQHAYAGGSLTTGLDLLADQALQGGMLKSEQKHAEQVIIAERRMAEKAVAEQAGPSKKCK
ncbi:hypothetical protein IAT38_006217 [Cryptococcus sp. DSM 104549]